MVQGCFIYGSEFNVTSAGIDVVCIVSSSLFIYFVCFGCCRRHLRFFSFLFG